MQPVFLILLMLLSFVSSADADTVFRAGMKETHIFSVYHLNNSQTQWTAESILAGEHDSAFLFSDRYVTFLGVPQSHNAGDHWAYLQVDNQSGEDIGLVSDYGTTASLSRIFFLDAQSRSLVRTEVKDHQLRRSREIFAVPPGLWRIYIEVRPDDFNLPVINFELKSMNALVHHSRELAFIAVSFGICFALIAYNLILALTLRNRAHFIYIAYNIAILLYYEGRYQMLAEQFSFPEIPKWALTPINASSMFLFLAFIYHMLGIGRNLRAWRWPIFGLFGLWPFLVVYSFIDRTQAQIMLLGLIVLSSPISISIAIHSVIRRIPGARLMLVSSILPGIGSFIHFMPQYSGRWLPMDLVACAQMFALDIEMILLSMTIGFKINGEQEWLRKKIDHAYRELQAIVYPHQVDQIWDGKPLSETMPLGEKNAFILVFDVVASSRMQIDDPRGFLSAVFHDCSSLMMENYQPDLMVANGYRVKEMGDGFLCSVNFPFACPSGNPADHSVTMAHRFLQIFQKHVAALGIEQSIHCSIGIAYGTVEAFYPESGAQVYDLFGRGIVLAHRYESMRDILFRWLKQRDDIVILHQRVYEQLSEDLKQEFTEVDLGSSDFKVRDDEDASRLYYQLAAGRMHKRMLRGA